MAKNLLIVESPAKAKTIEKYLGKDFVVRSSFGHIRDLPSNGLAVDIEGGYTPKYEISSDKYKVVKDLKEMVTKVEEVWLATDEDREGEAISWHICHVLGLNEATTKRIVFREITKPALQKAVQTPRTLDLNLVNAQQARRVIDRLVGYELSELLWKKVKGGLSAGRVQSVAVKLIAEREREIQQFKPEAFFRINALFPVLNAQNKLVDIKAELVSDFKTADTAKDFLNTCVGARYKIASIDTKPTKRSPSAPFTTSTLQQEASRKLGFSVTRTMRTAQNLYEAGHISYMRTDSTNLSETAIQDISAAINSLYGANYLQTRQYKTNKSNAQEAHEAIRPTQCAVQQVTGSKDEERLYELIWKRTIASQMSNAQIDKTTVDIHISTVNGAVLRASGEVIKFDGFLKVYLESTDDETDEATGALPPVAVNQVLTLKNMTATERFTRPLPRYTEASLVKKLEELGIGRPSTYAPTISRITDPAKGYISLESREGTQRAYVIYTLANDVIREAQTTETIGTEKNKLFPNDVGFLVSDFLDERFQRIMDYGFTAQIEQEFDTIAEGKLDWKKMVDKFYKPFKMELEKTKTEANRVSGERVLGTDPNSGRSLLVRLSRSGPVVQIGSASELTGTDEKPKYANLKPGQSLETITFDEAMQLFELPKILGSHDEQEVSVNAGRYGPYIKFGAAFVSLPKNEDPHGVTLDRAVQLIEERKQADAPIGHYNNLPITKGKGRFGPFIKWNELYINVPARIKIDQITLPQAIELIEDKVEKEANKYIRRWEEEQISIENGRYGPFIRYKKDMLKIPPIEGQKATPELAATLSLADVKKIVEATYPDAFKAKAPTSKKTTTAKKK
jgi:DNA topoisomerase-1